MIYLPKNAKNMLANAYHQGVELLYCSKCDDYFTKDNFHSQKSERGHSSYCKECTREVNRAYRMKRMTAV